MRCSSYCTASTYRIDDLAKLLREKDLDPKFYDDVIHIERMDEGGKGHVFFFPYGCVVFWGLETDLESEFLHLLKDFSHDPRPHIIHDECTFNYSDMTAIHEEDDEILLETEDDLIVLSISYGLSQSVKLTACEESINYTIQKTRHLPDELAKLGKITLSRKKLSQKLGALFAERHSINLHNDVLDTPEFFWRRPRYEPYYQMSAAYLDIQTRTEILNRRLGVIHELYGILADELKHLHSSRLEMIIIFLIVIEVIVAILKDILKVI
jgi:uncharacterized Rmd1/YagE family protein